MWTGMARILKCTESMSWDSYFTFWWLITRFNLPRATCTLNSWMAYLPAIGASSTATFSTTFIVNVKNNFFRHIFISHNNLSLINYRYSFLISIESPIYSVQIQSVWFYVCNQIFCHIFCRIQSANNKFVVWFEPELSSILMEFLRFCFFVNCYILFVIFWCIFSPIKSIYYTLMHVSWRHIVRNEWMGICLKLLDFAFRFISEMVDLFHILFIVFLSICSFSERLIITWITTGQM